MKNKYKRIKTFSVENENDGSTIVKEVVVVVPNDASNKIEEAPPIESKDKYRIGKKADNNVFGSLDELRKFALNNQIKVDNIVVTKIEESGEEKRLPYIEFAYNNRYFDISRKDGFYYKWEWEKRGPFSQNELSYQPIKNRWPNYSPIELTGINIKKKKSWWSRFKEFFKINKKRK